MTIFFIVIAIVILFVFLNPITQNSLQKSRDLEEIIQRYKNDYLNPTLMQEIYQYCMRHYLLREIVDKHNATIKDFTVIYIYLMSSCPVEKKGHFIPISTFFFASSLDYALSKKNFWTENDTKWILRYFD